ncbi:alpha-D-ribose 1-methylphosphonate 5-triphosphate synthase subunit PhnG [Ancylobacter sp. 3268]|uniref:phosphonate C-P lyase system protein PhnG n=1 Tax=Ancylobacter sp. 3268 TaxID=2817752 RepID=UPI00285ECAFF|nr:phosphonate C-P lyase system protein PhnG [Ancylobacter sp. 3268]MDR6951686.1 alpha-D-ribose 1-methylphosphonate 5-triphosphate synthase subunit PhnG [Ancylobacter sp. 3268]
MPQNSEKYSSDNVMPARKAALATLARARRDELDVMLGQLSPLPAARDLRPAEVGLVMLRGRMGGDGAPFNLGEATVSRAAIRLDGGATGFGYRLGRDIAAARQGALIDALWQDEDRRAAVEAALAPVRARLATEAGEARAETAATKVDFFTLVRGED